MHSYPVLQFQIPSVMAKSALVRDCAEQKPQYIQHWTQFKTGHYGSWFCPVHWNLLEIQHCRGNSAAETAYLKISDFLKY